MAASFSSSSHLIPPSLVQLESLLVKLQEPYLCLD